MSCRIGARLIAVATALLIGLAHAPPVRAHASLVAAEPADGAVIAQAPAELRLTFNEPVAPLRFGLVGRDGAAIALGTIAAQDTRVNVAVARLGRGTHVLSWRVISADGHPVGGALTFSIGAPSAPPAAGTLADPGVRIALWSVKVVLYAALFAGIGGAFFRAWIGSVSARGLDASLLVLIVLGMVAAATSVGLQGLDALELSLSGLARKAAWETGLETSYGTTAIVATSALFAGLFSLAATSERLARALAAAAMLGVGSALTLSGHAGNAAPQVLNRPAVFVHAVCVAFWVGALLPLLALVRMREAGGAALARFSRAIPLPLGLLVVSGLWLAAVQLGQIDALWRTPYGWVLCWKLAAVAALLALGALNRYRWVPDFQARGSAAARPLRRSIGCELAIALAIFGLVALWRFTPPPRAHVAAPIAFHLHGEKAMADIRIEREPAAAGRVTIVVLDGGFAPLAAKEVTLVLANPAAGIEPMRRAAAHAGDNAWRIDDLRIPVAGRWSVRVDVLVGDFEKVVLEDVATLPRLP